MMFNRSWIPSSLREPREFINERILKRRPLSRLAPGGPKNLRDSLPIQAERQMLDTLAAEDQKRAAEPAYRKKWKGEPLFIPPLHETSAIEVPADTPPGITLSSNSRSRVTSQEAQRPTVASLHRGNQNRTSQANTKNTVESISSGNQNRASHADTWTTVESVFSHDDNNDSNVNNDTDSSPDIDVPVLVFDLINSTDCPGQTVLMCNPTFLARLTHLLKARKAHKKAQHDAGLIKSATDTFALKLKMEIVRTEMRLRRFLPDIQLAKQYNVYDNATGGPSATSLKLERKLGMLRSFLERAAERYADIFVALDEQSQELRAAQAEVNANFEKAFVDAEMLGGEIGEPEGAKVADVIGEYRAFCRQNGIKWDGVEGGKLPESLRVGPVAEGVD